uniref:Tetraacyldisaccharide 4'-kinase n=1 Tax=Candidatus Kentrum sp. TUN TaxID=2126343 RepID=A0A450ZBW9_9GAMM|nr:MAG: lipid-A-disaccharide kinase [Candidatus Kentron sp. TUN]VFK51300.1 MAG: lipid-A-disaccharide kinase [Candidatus Kentron sp. TUN]
MLIPRLLLPRIWYRNHHPLGYALAPLSRLFCMAVSVRRFAYGKHLIAAQHPGVPVIVVGNITTGGTGKTPLVIWLANFLREHRFRPAIIVRGYGGKATCWPQWVVADTDPDMVGDEAVLLARRTSCCVIAAPDRVVAARALIEHTDCNLILSDDGLQHYALERDVEIAVVDGILGVGNGRCLPAGPLREPVSRLATVDLVVKNTPDHNLPESEPDHGEYGMRLISGDPQDVVGKRGARFLDTFKVSPVHAVCGIGHPDRFFRTLRQLGLSIRPHAFPDHHAFRPEDLAFGDDLSILMTEKDAVKCRRFAGPRHWYLPVDAELDPAFGARLLQALSDERITVTSRP